MGNRIADLCSILFPYGTIFVNIIIASKITCHFSHSQTLQQLFSPILSFLCSFFSITLLMLYSILENYLSFYSKLNERYRSISAHLERFRIFGIIREWVRKMFYEVRYNTNYYVKSPQIIWFKFRNNSTSVKLKGVESRYLKIVAENVDEMSFQLAFARLCYFIPKSF